MSEWVRTILDVVLIVMVGIGLVQAMRLIRHLAGLQQGRMDMERFVREFNATVMRAEAGIKNLRGAARESGDDLEKLVDKANMVRDELRYIVEAADQLADRLTTAASAATRPVEVKNGPKVVENPAASAAKPKEPEPAAPPPPSRAEKELLQALQKLK